MRAVPRWPAWLGAPVRRALGAGTAVAAAALACGWPHWRERPAAAAVTLVCCGGFAAAGGLLAAGRSGRRTGAAFLGASAAWAATWAAAWNAGAAPAVSVFAQSVFFVAVGAGVLLYPGGRLTGAARIWTAAAVVIMVGGQALLSAVSRPEWNGFAASAAWPSLRPGEEAFGCVQRGTAAAMAALAGALVVILVARVPRAGRLHRALTVPVTVAVTGGVTGALAVQGTLYGTSVTLDDVLDVYLVQGVCATVLPLVFLGAALRARFAELTVAERMHRLTGPVSAENVRAALRRVLRDDTLDLWLWTGDGHAGGDGRRMAAAPGEGRWRHEVRTSAGEPLATVEVSAALREHGPLVAAALVAGGRALETVRLEAVARAGLERARDARERLVRVQAAERERLAADLEDGARRRLRTLAGLLARLEDAAAGDPAARERARACRRELAEAVAELDDLARGVHPAVLTEAGLAAALEPVAARAAVPVRLDVPSRRFPPEVESTLYFALCEALANAVKHARAGSVEVTVRAAGGQVVAEVRDDGAGGAVPSPRGGLAGLTDRVGALRGRVAVDSPPGAGTTVTIVLPAP